jgi:acetolactate synthase-1/2/3 large subunit
VKDVAACLARDAFVVVGAGYHQQWANKVPVRAPRSYLQASASGSMGWALGGAIGAKLAYPDRQVVALIGDGDFASVTPDIETAVRCRQPIVYVVMNDRGYGALRAFQQTYYRGRQLGNDFANPDFGRLAELYGAAGAQVTRGGDLRPALEAALARTEQPTVIDVIIDGQEPYYRAPEFALFHQFAEF